MIKNPDKLYVGQKIYWVDSWGGAGDIDAYIIEALTVNSIVVDDSIYRKDAKYLFDDIVDANKEIIKAIRKRIRSLYTELKQKEEIIYRLDPDIVLMTDKELEEADQESKDPEYDEEN